MNNLDPWSRQQVIASLARLHPASVIRLGTVSRAMRNETANKRKHLNALKRLVRRRVARMRHFESPRHPGGTRGRIRNSLFDAKRQAHLIKVSSQALRISLQASRRRNAAAAAHGQYQRNGTLASWNRFVRIHAKRPGFTAQITRQQARNMYN